MKLLSRWIPVIGGAIAGGVIALIIASGTTGNTTTTVYQPSGGTGSSASSTSEPASIKSTGGMTINQIYRAASPGVVDILVTSQSQNPSLGFFGGGGGNQTQEGEGAGVVYNKQGYILTDEHVVANATSVKVTFNNGQKVSAKVIGTDPSTDVGVIKVDVPASELHPIPLGNSDAPQVGDPVVAIGSPFSLPETTTAGIVSQTGRSIMAPNNYTIPGAIQTDAPINPGNSGGPLLNADAQVIGLNDQIETNNTTQSGQGSSSGVGFATPINTDAKVANQIIAGKQVQHAYVGVELSGTSAGGAQVSSVQPNSPATAAGLQQGDLITAIDSKTVSSTDQFIATIDNYSPGQTVTLTVTRSGQSKQIQVKLGVRPSSSPNATGSNGTAP
ncbi:MAG TPA: trypsin-like peptidase domain-containing protein [Solirubrobacteraceae bacterium]|jgi:putative serine protease PepD|nr:trypsin-like peptidase domain-containing protein [Solirubrobacteraceae bacterium]